MTQADYDAVICGGGVAGSSAALWLGRYRRKTLLLDSGEQRNLPARRSHGRIGAGDTC
ncbi:MAG: FAD-binding protein [Actinomycetota bacterium]